MRKLTFFPLALLLLAGLGRVAPASATTIVMASDEQLTDRAAVVAQVTVTSAGPSASQTRRPTTEFEAQVERVLKGRVAGDTIVVRVPGGVRPDGLALKIWGSPEFEPGDRALLFLVPHADGTYGVLHLAMGAFREARAGGQRLAVRDLSEVAVVGEDGQVEDGTAEMARDFDGFSSWIASRAAGEAQAPDYRIEAPAGTMQSAQGRFTYLQNVRRRWFEFDRSITIGWRAHSGGQPGLASGGFPEFQQALNVWNNDPDTNIRLRYDGTTNTTTGFSDFDGQNVLLFEDPNGEADGTFTCVSPGNGSGVLAIGGPWFQSGQPEPVPIAGADIIINDGAGCWFITGARAAQVYAHELGHTLGLGHSCGDGLSGSCNTTEKNDALMRANAHADNRGAALGVDDRAGILTLYPLTTAPQKPAAPSLLVATVTSSTAVHLTWQDNATNETGFRLERKIGNGAFQEIQQPATNATSADVTGLTAATTYTFRIRARNAAGFSAYSNQVVITTTGNPIPAAPTRLTAEPLSTTQIRLIWQDNSSNETEFVIEKKSPSSGFAVTGSAPAGSTSATVDGLTADTPYTFRVRARNANGASAFSNEVSATTHGAGGACVPGPGTLCLVGGRFQVRVAWRTAGGTSGTGGAVPNSDQTGLFWFFDAANVELIVKVLDGRGINGFFWTFYGGLSDVEYWISVTDTQNGDSATYHNPAGSVCGGADVQSLPGSALAPASSASVISIPALAAGPFTPAIETVCAPGTLCLLGGRFQVEVSWESGTSAGLGTAVPVSDQTGLFWFFNSSNIELVVKVIDARPLNGKFWVFYGALSDVEYDITVTDTTTGAVKTYHNALGSICGQADTNAF